MAGDGSVRPAPWQHGCRGGHRGLASDRTACGLRLAAALTTAGLDPVVLLGPELQRATWSDLPHLSNAGAPAQLVFLKIESATAVALAAVCGSLSFSACASA